MTPWRHLAFAVAKVGVLAVLASGGGCYKPNIEDGGLRCTDAGACPEGFRCAADGTCKKGKPPVCTADMPRVQPFCAGTPGGSCDPVCQSGCDCGRCSLKGSTLDCVAVGTKMRGELCTPGTDDCAPGNICLEDCGGLVGRCFRFCGRGATQDTSVCGGQPCNVPVNDSSGGSTDLWVCPSPPQTCNPVGAANDCGHVELGCYFDDTIPSTVCDCKGKNMPNMGCSVFNSCVPGYRCVERAMMAPACLKTCRVAGDCPSGSSCQSGGALGYCSP